MTSSDAAQVLGLPPTATPEELEQRYHDLRGRIEEKIGKAPTPGLKEKYRASLAEVTMAFETLILAADGSTLPVLHRAPAEAPAAQVGPPRDAPRVLTAPPPATPRSRPKRNLEFFVAAAVSIGVLGGGGWWVLKTRAEKAEQARVAAETAAQAAAEAERDAQLARELKRQEEQAAQAEQQRVAQLTARTTTQLVDLRIAWETVEQELRRADRRLAELRSEERSLARGTPGPALLRLRAEIEAQGDYHQWLEGQVGRHEAKVLRAQAEALLSARQVDEAAKLADQAARAQAQLDAEMRANHEQMLTLAGALRVDVTPAAAAWSLTDAFGGTRTGRGTADVTDVPWGPVRLEVTLDGYQPKQVEGVLRRGESLELRYAFQPSSFRLTSEPEGAEIWIGDAPQGKTPATIEWPGEGELPVTLQLEGYHPTTASVRLGGNSAEAWQKVALNRILTGLTRPDFSRGPRRFVVTSESTGTSQSTSGGAQPVRSTTETVFEVTPEEGDWTGIRSTTRHSRDLVKGTDIFTPGTLIEFQRSGDTWVAAVREGGYADPQFQSPEFKANLERSLQPAAPTISYASAAWWPTAETSVGGTWSLPAEISQAWLGPPEAGEQRSATGRLLRFESTAAAQVAEVEFTLSRSYAKSEKHGNFLGSVATRQQGSTSFRIVLRIDLDRHYIPWMRTEQQFTFFYSIDGTSTQTSSTTTTETVTKPL